MTDDNIKYMAQRIYDIHQESQNRVLVDSLSAQLREVRTGIANITAAVEKGVISSTLIERLNNLEEQEIELKYNIEQEKAKFPDVTVEQLEFMLHKFCENIREINFEDRLYNLLINRIYYTKNKAHRGSWYALFFGAPILRWKYMKKKGWYWLVNSPIKC
ncbi:MAG: hypothetical protein J1G06_09500 [Oscillospiraceae bacterium]|nr:hypothetical protein [Oscillospiraceae bacterium]